MEKSESLKIMIGDRLCEHEVMRDHTTLKVGGVADFYYEARNINELTRAVDSAVSLKIPYLVIGNASNIVFSDFGFPGLIIKNITSNIALLKEQSQIIVDSGVNLPKLIVESASNDLSGLEFLYGVPGTIGGAIYGNAGAMGQSIGDYVKSVTLFLPSSEAEGESKVVQVSRKWMDFKYRESKLKNNVSLVKPIILSVKIQLSRGKKDEIVRKISMFKKNRLSSQPYTDTVGSIFRNLNGESGYENIVKEQTAGYLLDRSGAKKLKNGGAKVSNIHANFIVNSGDAKAIEVRQLVEEMRNLVQEKYQINLIEEIEYVGQW